MKIILFFVAILFVAGLMGAANSKRDGKLYKVFELINIISLFVLGIALIRILIDGVKIIDDDYFPCVFCCILFSGYHMYNKFFEGPGSINDKQRKKEESELLFKDACEHFDKKEYQLALKCYDKAIELGFTESKVFRNRAATLFDLEYYIDAIKDYDKAIETWPKDAHLRYNRGLCRWRTGDLFGAKEDYKNAIELSKVDTYENQKLNERAKLLGSGWKDATHVYETFSWELFDEIDKIFMQEGIARGRLYHENVEKARLKRRTL